MPTSILVTTVGGTTSNAYCDWTYLTAYFANLPYGSSFVNIGATIGEKYIIQATAEIDLHKFYGDFPSGGNPVSGYNTGKLNYNQSLKFPRNVQDDITIIPLEVKQACCEQALFIWTNISADSASLGRNPRQRLRSDGVKEFVVDDLKESLTPVKSIYLCPKAIALLDKWFLKKNGRVVFNSDVLPADGHVPYYWDTFGWGEK